MAHARAINTLDRRRLLTGAGSSLAALRLEHSRGQESAPIPVPVRIQTPDLAFVEALQSQLDLYQQTGAGEDLLLSIVPAEPASESLLTDLRSAGRRFTGSFVPYWTIPDLTRDSFIEPLDSPSATLPRAVAHLRSFDGQWVATDFDHDCDLLFYRRDVLEDAQVDFPQTWTELLELTMGSGLPVSVPQTHAQQAVEHFTAMAASYVGSKAFWFDPTSMEPTIASADHQAALQVWKTLANATPGSLRSGSTGNLWQGLMDGSTVFLVGSADFFPFAMQRIAEPESIGIALLPGLANDAGTVQRVGNAAGPNWGGVVISGMPESQLAAGFLDHLSTHESQRAISSNPDSGVTPRSAEDFSAGGTSTTPVWPVESTSAWLDAIHDTLDNPVQLLPLRIAETRRYLLALEARIVEFLASDSVTAEAALSAVADDWRAINEAIGIETQHNLFLRSLQPPP